MREPNGPADVALTTTFNRKRPRPRHARYPAGRIRAKAAVTDIGYDPFVGHLPETMARRASRSRSQTHPPSGLWRAPRTRTGRRQLSSTTRSAASRRVIPESCHGSTTLTYSPVLAGAGLSQSVTRPRERQIAARRSTSSDGRGISLGQGLATNVFSATVENDAAGRVARISRPTAPALSSPAEAWVLYQLCLYDAAVRTTRTTYPAEGVDVSGIPKRPDR